MFFIYLIFLEQIQRTTIPIQHKWPKETSNRPLLDEINKTPAMDRIKKLVAIAAKFGNSSSVLISPNGILPYKLLENLYLTKRRNTVLYFVTCLRARIDMVASCVQPNNTRFCTWECQMKGTFSREIEPFIWARYEDVLYIYIYR